MRELPIALISGDLLADDRQAAAAYDLIDEIDLHRARVLLGDGIRLYDAPGGEPVHLQRAGDDPT